MYFYPKDKNTMHYQYQVFGLYCASEIEIPAFFPVVSVGEKVDFRVELGKVEEVFEEEAQVVEDNSRMNQREFFMEVEGVARYFVKNGNQVTIEPLSEEMRDVLLYFKSNCMAAILFQRGKIPFHVSGVVDEDGGVWLFAGESGMGKSTTALKLRERGYAHFTDDTALIYVENGQCWARASYPMIKAWPTTVENQKVYGEESSFPIMSDWEKKGIYFHEQFINTPRKVKGIIFLNMEGEKIVTRPLKPLEGMMQLLPNVYRGHWVTALHQNALQFKTVSEIANTVNFCEAVRPLETSTFEAFAAAIDLHIMQHENMGTCVEKVV
jgi:hypothetical protein